MQIVLDDVSTFWAPSGFIPTESDTNVFLSCQIFKLSIEPQIDIPESLASNFFRLSTDSSGWIFLISLILLNVNFELFIDGEHGLSPTANLKSRGWDHRDA